MAIRIPYGIDPDEVWELDFCAEVARSKEQMERETATSLREAASIQASPETKAAFEERAARSEAKADEAVRDLKEYQPGSGPVFKVGAIKGHRRAELVGRRVEIFRMEEGRDREVALFDWSLDVIKEAVRGHRNLKTSSGADVTYDSTDGRPSARTLESYAPIVLDLAHVVVAQQRLEADGKNA